MRQFFSPCTGASRHKTQLQSGFPSHRSGLFFCRWLTFLALNFRLLHSFGFGRLSFLQLKTSFPSSISTPTNSSPPLLKKVLGMSHRVGIRLVQRCVQLLQHEPAHGHPLVTLRLQQLEFTHTHTHTHTHTSASKQQAEHRHPNTLKECKMVNWSSFLFGAQAQTGEKL